ncbi:hypothetical protein FLONG3_4911 [Fusarium longipes]|uniref:Uncharacterized protein n=1 Tax=Fusarium longipes TaxID=694270 RepID=A0A395SWV8_9HYPO|nr:hypothetical protein FLONG3_4911 [Fusarium longipes]
MSENNHASDGPSGSFPPSQSWTIDGYPIVDGKYHDLATDQIKTHVGPMSAGPPSLTIYWHNCASVTQPDQFFAMGLFSRLTVTEYISRVVHVILMTDLSSGDFRGLLQEYGILASG